tara:strand:- start:245 stop:1561 length:1317 start_codon:yes stop_codon:yes gene_type:complete
MASNTKIGATKPGRRGQRLRWNGKKWVPIKATGRGGNTTSSRNRSQRQSRSNANVTTSNRESKSTAITKTNNSSLAVRSGQLANQSGLTRQGGLAVQGGLVNQGATGPRGMRTRLPPAQNVFSEALQRQLQSGQRSINPATPQNALPKGQRGGDLAGKTRVRRSNINRSSSSGNTQMGTRGGGVRQQGQLPSFYDRIAEQLQKARQEGVRYADRNNPYRAKAKGARKYTGVTAKYGGAREAAIAEALSFLLDPLVRELGFQGGAALRRSMGGGEPTLDKYGNVINPVPTPGVDAPGSVEGLNDVAGNPLQIIYAGPGGDPSGSGKGQAQRGGTGRWTVDGFVAEAPSIPEAPAATSNVDNTQVNNPPPAPQLPPPPTYTNPSPPARTPRQQPQTGRNDPRNKAYIEALKALNSNPNPSKQERDKVRNIGLEIHKAIYG